MRLGQMEKSNTCLVPKRPHVPNTKYSEGQAEKAASKKKVTAPIVVGFLIQ